MYELTELKNTVDETVKAVEQKIKSLQSEIDELKGEVDELEEGNAELEGELDDIGSELGDIRGSTLYDEYKFEIVKRISDNLTLVELQRLENLLKKKFGRKFETHYHIE